MSNNAKLNIQELSLEEAFGQLEQLLSDMEQGDRSLEETFALYSQGVELVRGCHEKMDVIEKKLIVLNEEGKGLAE